MEKYFKMWLAIFWPSFLGGQSVNQHETMFFITLSFITRYYTYSTSDKCRIEIKSMGKCKKDVTPLLTHWSYVFLTLTHRNHKPTKDTLIPRPPRVAMWVSFVSIFEKIYPVIMRFFSAACTPVFLLTSWQGHHDIFYHIDPAGLPCMELKCTYNSRVKIRKNIYRFDVQVTFKQLLYRSFIQNKTTFAEYCLTQWIWKLPCSTWYFHRSGRHK